MLDLPYAANYCLTSIVVTLAFYHAIGKRQNSSGDQSYLVEFLEAGLVSIIVLNELL